MGGPKRRSVAGPARHERRGGIFSRFVHANDGATAIEFGIVVMPFMLLLLAIVETVMMFWTNSVLEEAVSEVSRTLLTGQSRNIYTSTVPDAFQNNICNYASGFIDCGRLKVDVKTYSNFAGATASSPVSGVIDTSNFAYRQPGAGQIVVVRAILPYKAFLNQWSSAFASTEDGTPSLVAVAVFQTEPFT